MNFQKYFDLGGEESASPFLDRTGKRLSRNMRLKSASLAAFFLLMSVIISFYESMFYRIPLSFVYFLAGIPALIEALENIFIEKDINIDVLMTLSAFAALAIGHEHEGALLFVLFALSESLEDTVTLKAKSALSSIHEIAPTKACVIHKDNSTVERSIYDIEIGMHLLVRSGEIVPLDGIVVSGSGSFSSSHITGESRDHTVDIGDSLASGSRLIQGSVTIQVMTKQADSTVMKIIQLITEAENSKPKYTQLFERFGRIYALTVIITTFSLLFLLPFLFQVPLHGEDGALIRAISFLITASPCALFIAVPIAYLSALSSSVASGAILKGGNVFDILNSCSTVVFDKTGTLTQGNFQFLQFFEMEQRYGASEFIQRITEEEVIRIAASVEQHVVHPIAKAIVSYSEEKQLSLYEVSSVHVYAGVGVSAELIIDSYSIHVEIRSPTKNEEEKIYTALSLNENSQFAGSSCVSISISDKNSPESCGTFLLVFEDSIRDESFEALSFLKKLKKEIIMLSGDHVLIAKKIAEHLQIEEWKGNLRPEDKLRIVTSLAQRKLKGLVMVGDGMNDAPALARAHVGISMGKFSSASARDAADVVLLDDNLKLIPWLFEKAEQTDRIVTQNLLFALFSIAIGTVSSLWGIIPLWAAVILHEGSTLLVGVNALRLLRSPLSKRK